MKHIARRWSIARRLTLLYGASSFLMLALAAIYLYWSLASNLEREDNAFLTDKVRVLRNLLRDSPGGVSLLAPQSVAEMPRLLQYFVRVSKATGQTVVETPGMSDFMAQVPFPSPFGADETPEIGIEVDAGAGKSFRLMSAWAKVGPSGSEQYLIQVALDVSDDDVLMRSFRRNLVFLLIGGLVFSCVMGIFIARKGLRPLEEIAQATYRVSASQLHGRLLPKHWPKELELLAKGFDRMLERLEDSFTRLSQFSADLAHELRTPINNLRGQAGVALSRVRSPDEYQRVLESSLEEYERLARLIDNLLFLARADAPTSNLQHSSFDARQAIETVREFYEALAGERGITVVCEGNAKVEAEPTLFRQATSNLLSNALNFTARGGKVVVSVRQNNGVVELTVSDNGCGIPPEHLPRIFDRLYRVDPARSQSPSGAGLGLAIVKSIAALHGGAATAQSEPGKGSCFRLTFPAASSDAQATLAPM